MPYVNKEVFGACEWKVLEKAAYKELAFREPPPVRPAFASWFASTFPTVQDTNLRSLIYKTICKSAKNEEQPLSHEFIRDIYHLSDKGAVTNLISAIGKVFDVDCSFYSKVTHYARNIQIDQSKAQSLLAQWNSFVVKKKDPEYPDRISPLTEEKIDQKYQEVIVDSKSCVKKHTEKRFKEECYPVIRMIKYLNERKIPQIVLDRLDNLIDSLDPKEDEIRYHSLVAAKNGLVGNLVWKINKNAYRIYPIGPSLITIKKEDRWEIMRKEDGFVEVDLTNAHFAILAKLINSSEMNQMLNNGSIWKQLLTYLNLDFSFKESLKQVIYSILYGSGSGLQKILLIQNPTIKETLFSESSKLLKEEKKAVTKEEKLVCIQARRELEKKIDELSTPEEKELYTKLISHPAIQELISGKENLIKEIIKSGYYVDAFGKKHSAKDIQSGQILHHLCTSYEKILTREIYAEVYDRSSVEVILDQHDGLTLHFHSEKNKEEILQKIQQRVEEKAKENNINTRVEYKG